MRNVEDNAQCPNTPPSAGPAVRYYATNAASTKGAAVIVKIVQRQGQAALVEWTDNGVTRRSTVPASVVEKGRVPTAELRRGIPYGEPWEDLIELHATPATLAAELRRRGIWTVDDLQANAEVARGAIMDAYGCELAHLLRAVKERREEG